MMNVELVTGWKVVTLFIMIISYPQLMEWLTYITSYQLVLHACDY
jgi:hypothetical protein